MGDWFQTFVDLDVAESDAAALADHLTAVLVKEEIVEAEITDCVLAESGGHRPGPRWVDVVDRPSDEEHLLDLMANGFHAEVGRHFFHCGQDEPYFACPDGHPLPWEDCVASLNEWWTDQRDDVVVTCGACAAEYLLRSLDSNCAAANLGFTFWNWPSLTSDFRELVAKQLAPHRVRFIASKL